MRFLHVSNFIQDGAESKVYLHVPSSKIFFNVFLCKRRLQDVYENFKCLFGCLYILLGTQI